MANLEGSPSTPATEPSNDGRFRGAAVGDGPALDLGLGFERYVQAVKYPPYSAAGAVSARVGLVRGLAVCSAVTGFGHGRRQTARPALTARTSRRWQSSGLVDSPRPRSGQPVPPETYTRTGQPVPRPQGSRPRRLFAHVVERLVSVSGRAVSRGGQVIFRVRDEGLL